MKYAVAINSQGRFAPTIVGEFVYDPEHDLHVWKAKLATTMKELAEQVNEASAFLTNWNTPFVTLRVVEVDAKPELRDSTKESLIQANAELLAVISCCGMTKEIGA